MDILTTGLITHLESKQCSSQFEQGVGGEYYLHVPYKEIGEAIGWLATRNDLALIDIWAILNPNKSSVNLFYAFELRYPSPILIITVKTETSQAPSIWGQFPVAIYFERRLNDLFGMEFTGSPDTRRLLLHEIYPADFHPMLESNPRSLTVPPSPGMTSEYAFKIFEGEGIYQVPVGPVHAGVIEPGHFRFSVMGETIFNLEARLGYKHRGLNKLAEGKSVDEGVKLAETVSGDESAANACCFSMAVEKITGAELPRRAWELRTILLEMERIYSHLGDLAGMLVDIAYPVGASPFFILREEMLRWNAAFTGSRFLKGAIKPGGVNRDIDHQALQDFKRYLDNFCRQIESALSTVNEAAGVIDRFDTTGIVLPMLIAPLSLSGPVARASGYDGDTRQLHPYSIYNELKYKVPVKTTGDVLARFKLKSEEIFSSVNLIRDLIANCSSGPVFLDFHPKSGQALAMIEAPRGRNLHWLKLKNGNIERWEVLTASFCNWLAIEHAVIGNIIPDFPVINKSFNLSYAGNDL
ncbi:MAG: NADH-quinone oxidoreductase subunit C [Dehalococcoidales bacterium]|jgi:Ni,Fe-hydrogenase III large subunit/Ni,Fe-hydrogenase III component G|nr:NADH-quinone oxidoreductase subunit C [Dehalococcoidales bacterium]MDX9986196.1 NADH-quinone oxidoreductase subunit C [Dehalococcoidales bacterium]NLE89504.1 hydrogenase large subunit [Dehalococcoidales bacterium]